MNKDEIYEILEASDLRQKAFVDCLLELIIKWELSLHTKEETHKLNFMNQMKEFINKWCPAVKDE